MIFPSGIDNLRGDMVQKRRCEHRHWNHSEGKLRGIMLRLRGRVKENNGNYGEKGALSGA